MDLFENDLYNNKPSQASIIAEGVVFLHSFALQKAAQLQADLQQILQCSPLRHMTTRGGFTMSVAMTNCGDLGWVSDEKGYRYSALDPSTEAPWQPMPASFSALANSAALQAGYANFAPDVCLINQYRPAARMSLHQDKDEHDFNQPIVSVSLGVPATFLFGGAKRSDKPFKIQLHHGDVIVWGGKSRLNYHGIMPLKPSIHATFGAYRYNLTFRKAA